MACAHSELSTGHCGRRYGTKIFQDDSCSPSTRPRCKLSCPRPCHIEPAYARLVAYTAGIVRRGAKWHAAVNLKLFEVQARVEIQGTPQPEDPMVQGVHTQTLSASMLSCACRTCTQIVRAECDMVTVPRAPLLGMLSMAYLLTSCNGYKCTQHNILRRRRQGEA